MYFHVTPESAMAFTKTSVKLVCSWPPSSKASRFDRLRFRIYWWIALIILLQLFFPLLNGIWTNRNDVPIVVNTILLSSATAQALIKIIVCHCQRHRFQALHAEMEEFMRKTRPSESQILQRYVERTINFYGFVGACIYLASLSFILEPIILSRSLPTDASYPFDVHLHPIHEFLYASQTIAILHVASALFIDSQVAILLWFTAARFEMLGDEFASVTNQKDLNYCIVKHQEILRYASEVKQATRFIALATMATTTVGILCGGLTLMSRQPISVTLRVGNVIINAVVELFVYAWPADNLIEMSKNIGDRAYCSAWLGQPIAMLKSIAIIIQRSQKPSIISVGGFLPSLSLNHYVSFLSSSLSYFTTLRVIYGSAET